MSMMTSRQARPWPNRTSSCREIPLVAWLRASGGLGLGHRWRIVMAALRWPGAFGQNRLGFVCNAKARRLWKRDRKTSASHAGTIICHVAACGRIARDKARTNTGNCTGACKNPCPNGADQPPRSWRDRGHNIGQSGFTARHQPRGIFPLACAFRLSTRTLSAAIGGARGLQVNPCCDEHGDSANCARGRTCASDRHRQHRPAQGTSVNGTGYGRGSRHRICSRKPFPRPNH